MVELKNIAYGNHERQILDIFIPDNIKCVCGIIIFIHGGGWHMGDKSAHYEDSYYFCNMGYICAAMNYRFVSDDVSVYNELDDISSALETVKKICSEKGLNITKTILSGASAGGHLSLMYAYTRKNQSPISPVAVCVYSPPVKCYKSDFLSGISDEFNDWKYDLLSKCSGYKITQETLLDFNEQSALKKISPNEYVACSSVPTAVFCGKYDNLVPLNHIEDFIVTLNKCRIDNTLLIYENSGHELNKDPETAFTAKNTIKAYAEKYF